LETSAASAVFAGCDAQNLTHVIFVHKGLVWFLLATIAEVPPTVCLGILLAPHFPLSRFRATGVYNFEPQWYLHSPRPFMSINSTQFGFNSPDPFNIVHSCSYEWNWFLYSLQQMFQAQMEAPLNRSRSGGCTYTLRAVRGGRPIWLVHQQG
jgi:hypothetical protein